MTDDYVPPHKRSEFSLQRASSGYDYESYQRPQRQQMGYQRQGYQNMSSHRGGMQGGFGGSQRYGGHQEYGRSQYGGYQAHYKVDRFNRHSNYENRATYDKSIFANQGSGMGINFDEYDKIEVATENYDDFEPLKTFEDANLHPTVMNNIKLCKYTKPTPIQRYSLPVIMGERDLMACAQTGSGKTAAFLLPIIDNMVAHPKEEIGFHASSKCYPKALIISPTRELAQQIHKDCSKFLYQTGLCSGCIFGGSKVDKQLRFLENNRVDILVATVGRLWDFFERGKLSFEDVHYFILDEADNMLDMGFERQINMILYESDLPQDRLNLLFSATMPREIQQLASEFLNNYVFLSFGMVGSVTKLVTQSFERVDKHEKFDRLEELLEEDKRAKVLVFTAMKRTADDLEWRLRENKDIGFSIAIHGDKSQRDRERALNGFRSGRYSVLIATDVAARGLDIKDITKVVQYDMPANIDSYVHRVGRTGRCGNKGDAISFVNRDNANVIGDLIKQLEKEELEVPEWMHSLSYRKKGKGGRKGGYKGRGGRRGGSRRH